jgi:hypothetical protein
MRETRAVVVRAGDLSREAGFDPAAVRRLRWLIVPVVSRPWARSVNGELRYGWNPCTFPIKTSRLWLQDAHDHPPNGFLAIIASSLPFATRNSVIFLTYWNRLL